MRVITIQNKNVVDTLLKTGKYTLDNAVLYANLIKPYQFMMKHYNYNHYPIFLCPVGYRVNFGGANLENAYMIEMEIPDRYCKIQDYYGWSDFIYFNECPNEFTGFIRCNTVEQYGTYILDMYKSKKLIDHKVVYQVTTQFLNKSWIKTIKPVNESFIELYYDTGGANILRSIANK